MTKSPYFWTRVLKSRVVLSQVESDRDFIDGELTLVDLYSFAKQIAVGMVRINAIIKMCHPLVK